MQADIDILQRKGVNDTYYLVIDSFNLEALYTVVELVHVDRFQLFVA